MDTKWKRVPQSAWELDQQGQLSHLKDQGFEPTTDPPNTRIVIGGDWIEIEVKSVDPG